MSEKSNIPIVTKLYTIWADSLFMAGCFYHVVKIEEVTEGNATVTRNVYNLGMLKCGMMRKFPQTVYYKEGKPYMIPKDVFTKKLNEHVSDYVKTVREQSGTIVSEMMQETYKTAAMIYYEKAKQIPGIGSK